MSAFGFSVGDFLSGIRLCSEIIAICSDGLKGGYQSHKDFSDTARSLMVGLQGLADVVRDRNRTAGGAGAFRNQHDEATWACLREITLDFRVTLETVQLRLKQYPVTKESRFGTKILYWLDSKGEIGDLLDRCRYHVTTINFVLEPFRIKVMTDIQQTLEEIHSDVRGMRGDVIDINIGVTRIADSFDELLLHFGCKPEPAHEPAPRPTGRRLPAAPLTLEINSDDSLNHRFRNQMRDDWENPEIELKDIPLLELTKSVVWWLDKNQIYVENAPDRGDLTPLQYLGLRKSAWVASGFSDHLALKDSSDKNSLWHAYCKRLEEEVNLVFSIMKRKKLRIPSVDSIHSLESHCFSPLVEIEVEPDNTLAGHGEDLILQLTLPGAHSQTQPTRFLAFRQGNGHLRCVEVVRSSQGRGRIIKETIREYVVNRSEWNIRPFYMFRPGEGCWNLALYKLPETKPFTFSSQRDLFAFQHAFMDANVRYVSMSSTFKKITYQDPAIMKGSCEFSSGLLQLWYEKPRPCLDMEGNTPTEASLSPTTTYSTENSSAPGAFSDSTSTKHKQDRTTTVVSLRPVETSRVFACLISVNGTKQFITFKLGSAIGFSNTSCCSSFHLHPKKGKGKQVPREESEICCRKLVIETVAQGGSFPVEILESKKDDDDTFGISLGENRLPKGSKFKLSYFTIMFGSVTEKFQFITKYHELETIRIVKEKRREKLIFDLQERERRGEQPKSEDPPRTLKTRLDSFWSLGTHDLGLKTR